MRIGLNSNIKDIDFSKYITDIKKEIPTHIIEYDNDTIEKYRVLRMRKMDPMTHVELSDECAFKFKYKWDPYTGERLNPDQNGPLYFDPDVLIRYFYLARLNKLWVQEHDEGIDGDYYQGYYDEGVGTGENFYIHPKGNRPEWYLFRLPIIDCYLTKDHNKQIITVGPKLTNDELQEIEKLAQLRPNNYYFQYKQNRPSLMEIKRIYDIAISIEPPIENRELLLLDKERLLQEYNKINRIAVDQLVNI